MSWFDRIFNRDTELGFIYDAELWDKGVNNIHMKKLAIEMCVGFLARTISQTEFKVNGAVTKKDKNAEDEIYYRLNVRPNKNMTSSTFWQTFIYKLIYDNECLVIQADDGDLLIADSFEHQEYAVYEDLFKKIVIKDYEFSRNYKQSEVIHLRFGNERLKPLIDSLFKDYGELFERTIDAQKRKSQIRGTVDMDMISTKDKEKQTKLQEFIDNMYKAIANNDVAIIPQQPGFKYTEMSAKGASGQGVEEVNKATNGFLEQLAMAIGIPFGLLRGDMADVNNQTKNYMFFTVSPLLKKLQDEVNVKFFSQEDYTKGKRVDIRKPSYRDIFDLATAVDKLRASGVMNGNELRDELGLVSVDSESMDNYVITKNYRDADDTDDQQADEGGENE